MNVADIDEELPAIGGISVVSRLQKRLIELQEEFLKVVGKTVFTPQDVERLTNLLAPILFTLKGSLPESYALEKFWKYWKEPAAFAQDHPDDLYYIIYYEKGNTVYAEPARSEEEMKKKSREITVRGGRVLNVRLLPAPPLLKEIIELVLDTGAQLGLISVRPPMPNKAFLFSEEEAESIAREIMEGL